jgi:hypothetical protein
VEDVLFIHQIVPRAAEGRWADDEYFLEVAPLFVYQILHELGFPGSTPGTTDDPFIAYVDLHLLLL